SFNDFLLNLGPLAVVLMGVFVLLARWLFRASFTYDAERAAAVMDLDERRAIRDPKLLSRSLVVLALILVFFSLHTVLHIDPSVVALLGAGALVLVSGTTSEEFLEDVEWETLVFFAGLFIMVGALVNIGVIEFLGEKAVDAVGGRYLLAVTGLLFGSAALSGIVDNIPYVATMSPLVDGLVESGDGSTQANALWWALALGADLGGNATAVGASANVVIIGIAARNGHPISFWHFTKYGLVVATVTIAIAWPYLYLRYYAFG
ncbi:MAG: SLC13 family permease, partial [Actinomycetota bacterium]|nr:SLC13 family permease [Actinomycetota bacterium]